MRGQSERLRLLSSPYSDLLPEGESTHTRKVSAELHTIARFEQDGVKILAYVSTPPAERLSIIDLKAFSARVLPAYMVPDTFIVLDQLPRTSTDKIDLQALRASQ